MTDQEQNSPRRVRVLIVTGSLDVGGTERHLCQVLPSLVGDEFEISVLTITHKGSLAPILEAAGIEVLAPVMPRAIRHRRPLRVAIAIFWLFSQIRRHRPDIVHTFLPEAYLTAGPVSLLLRTPIRIMSRRSLNHYQKRLPTIAWIERHLHRHMTVLLGNSAAVTTQLEAEINPGSDHVRLIYNGVDLALFSTVRAREDVRRDLGIPESATVFITVANLIAYKGHADEIAAFGLAAAKLPQPWRLLIVGQDNGILAQLRALADALGLSENILWLGQRSDVPNLLNASDIGVLVSHEEGFTNTVLEGMAAGLPMIVSDVGGNSELVRNGENGLLVPPRNPDMLAEAFTALSMDLAGRRAMSIAALRTITSGFTLDVCVRAYQKLYRGLVSQNIARTG